MNEDNLKQIAERLGQIVRLLATRTIEGKKQNEAITLLGAAGLDRNLIAEILGTTPNTVSVRISQAKAQKKKGA